MANDGNHTSHGGGVRDYVIVALILGVITYVEFAIIEYEIPWMSSGFTLWFLMILSVVKFVMVIMFFMHLKDDDAVYSGFFSAGMLLALGTFVAFAFMMTAPASIAYLRASAAPTSAEAEHGEAEPGGAEHGEEGLDAQTRALVESDGYSRDRADIMDAGRPKDQSLRVEPPAAPEPAATLAQAPAGEAADGDPEGGEPEPPAAGAQPEQEPEEAPAAPDDVSADAAAAAPDTDWDRELGEQVYGANCAACHQANGQGIPGAFPPLAGHAAEVAGVEGGREYLVHAVLYGLQGSIDVQGSTYDGVMPAWAQLGDDEVAAVLNHVVHLDGAGADVAPISPDEVAERRGAGLSAQDVHAQREELALP